jgi:FkbM family methyltransferase
MLFRSYARTRYQPGMRVERLTTRYGDLFDADLSSSLEWHLWAFGGYEEHFAELFRCLVSSGDRCIDVGANVGVHTVRLAKLAGAAGEVIAIEPDAGVAERNRRNIMLNDLANARVINAAASDQTGHMRLYRPDPSDTNRARASLHRHPYLTGDTATVPVLTIDEICDGPVTLMKIDVEGHEAAVLRGAAAVVARHAPSIIFEYAPELLDEVTQAPFGWLAEQEYELFGIRWIRRSVTGRGQLSLERLSGPPAVGGDYLAVTRSRAARLDELVA